MKEDPMTLGASASYTTKVMVAKTSLLAVSVAFELAAKYVPEVRVEIERWPEGIVFSMGILPDGPHITIKKEGKDQVRYLGTGLQNPDVAILFKNVDCALMVFTGQIGTHTAAAEKRFIIRGNISESMMISRTLAMVQAYLFPALITDKTFRRPPVLTGEQMVAKAKIMAALTPGLVLGAFK